MLFYHFTCLEHLEKIFVEGLSRGEVPLTLDEIVNAVWFTTSALPHGHGVYEERVFTEDDRRAIKQKIGQDVPEGARTPDKTAVRITVKIPSTDRKLKRWLPYARKRIEPQWLDILHKDCRPETWWLYFGTIPPERFSTVKFRNGDEYAEA